MALFESKEKKGKTYIIIVGILFLVGLIVWLVFGAGSIIKGVVIFFEILLVLGTLFAIAYLFYYLFIKKNKFDVNYVNKQRLIDAGTRLKRPILKDLYVSGDKGHTRSKVGKISGYLRMQVMTRNYIYDDTIDEKGNATKQLRTKENERGEQVSEYEIGYVEQDVFIIKSEGLLSFFEDPMVVRVNPEDHDELVGDVTLFGYSLIPICEYWFLNTDYLDVRKIDFAILKEAERTIAFVTLSDMKALIDKATGIDASHKKLIEAKSLVEIPETANVNRPSTLQ